MGRVCRICDHKFFMRAMFENHARLVNHYRTLRDEQESEVEARQKKFTEL